MNNDSEKGGSIAVDIALVLSGVFPAMIIGMVGMTFGISGNVIALIVLLIVFSAPFLLIAIDKFIGRLESK